VEHAVENVSGLRDRLGFSPLKWKQRWATSSDGGPHSFKFFFEILLVTPNHHNMKLAIGLG